VILPLAFKTERPFAEPIIRMRIRWGKEALYMNSVVNFAGKAFTLSTVHSLAYNLVQSPSDPRPLGRAGRYGDNYLV
jgi:hypothetical protein